MYALASAALVLACAPLTWALALLLAAALLRGRPRLAWSLGAAGLLTLLGFSLDPVASRLQRGLERSAPYTYQPDPPYDVVVVLGGAVETGAGRGAGLLELNAAGDRLTTGFEVVHAGKARNILVSGGNVFPEPDTVTEADLFTAALVRWGVPAEHVVAEPRSRNTRENAEETARLLRERGWSRVLLVTSAAHMERALGCFRKAGVAADALPTDHRAAAGPGFGWFPRSGALDKSSEAMREHLGRLMYRLAGYTAEP